MARPAVLETIRNAIVDGTFVPGQRLPNRSKWEAQFCCSSHTVQRAMNQLIRDGFVVARGRAGTFVSSSPPHLCRFGIVFPIHLDAAHSGTWARMWCELERHVTGLNDDHQSWQCYFGVNAEGMSASRQQLLDDLAARRLAGVFLVAPDTFPDWNAVSSVPCVAMHTDGVPDISTVRLDRDAFWHCSFASLRDAGCRRVAVLTSDMMGTDFWGYLQQALADYGLETQPQWVMGVSPRFPYWAANSVHAMFHSAQTQRPDGLFITDDAFLPPAAAGLLDLGVCPGRDIELVAHANFPISEVLPWPCTRIGFELPAIVRAFCQLVERARNDDCAADNIDVPVVVRTEPVPDASVVRHQSEALP